MNYIGIDPGSNGGIAVLNDSGLTVAKLPDGERDRIGLVREVTADDCFVAIEKVGGYIGGGATCPVCKQAKNQSPGSSMFNFGRGVGVLVASLIFSGKEFAEVEPQEWQAMLGLKRAKGCDKPAWKRLLKEAAQRMYPRVKITLATCDAILLARYARLSRQGASSGVSIDE